MLSSRIVIQFAIVCFVNPNYGLEPSQEITAMTDDAIRHVVNDIFSSLRTIMNKSKKVKKYSAIHKHFVKLTRHENDNWNEVLKPSRHDVKIDNGSADFMTVINEVLNDENKTEGTSDLLNGDNANRSIEYFLKTLKKLKENYLLNNSDSTENDEVLQFFYKVRNNTGDNANVSSENGVNESGVWVPSETRRIFHGERTKIQNYPFVVSVHFFNKFTCAGSIIYADLVITAASCLQLLYNNRFFRENPLSLTVRVGSSYYDIGGEVIPVVEVYFHPLYDPPTLRNNLAIMRLRRRIKFSKKERKVKLIEIDRNNWALPPNTAGITLLGWGAKNRHNKVKVGFEDKLSEVELDYYPIYECQKIYPKSQVMDKSFCAGFFAQGGGACNRDVGGPGVVHGQLMGVVTFGAPSCGATAAPTVFTKVGFYADWIESIMEQTPTKYKARITTRGRPYFHQTIEASKELTDKRFTIQPILQSTTGSSRETNLRTLYDEQFKELLKNKYLSEMPNFQQTTVKKQAKEENKRHAQNKTNENTESLEDADMITRGSRSSTDITFEPRTYLDIEELYGLSSPDKTFEKKGDTVTTAITVPAPGDMNEKLLFDDEKVSSNETDREQAVVNSKIRTKPHENTVSTNYSVLLQQILLLESEDKTLSSNSLEVKQNMLAETERNALQNLILALDPSVEDFESIKDNSQPKNLQNSEGSHPETQHNPEGFDRKTQYSPEGFDPKTKYRLEGFQPKKQHSPEGSRPETQHYPEGFDRKTQYSPEGIDPKTPYRPEGSRPEIQHNLGGFDRKTQYNPEGFDPKTGYRPEGFQPKKQHSPEGSRPETQHNPGGFDRKTQYIPEGINSKTEYRLEGFDPNIRYSPEGFDPNELNRFIGFELKKHYSVRGMDPKEQHSFKGFDPKTQQSFTGYEDIQLNTQHRSELINYVTTSSTKKDDRFKIDETNYVQVHNLMKQYSLKGFEPKELPNSEVYEQNKQISSDARNEVIRPPRMKIDGIGLPKRKPVETPIARQLAKQIDQININVNKIANSNVVKRTHTKIQEYLKHQEQKENPATNSDILSQLFNYAGEY